MFLDALLTLAHATAVTTNLLGGKMQFKLRALLAVALVSAFVFAPPAVPAQAKPPVSLGNGRAEEVGMSTQRLEKITSEPPRVCRRPFGLSYAAMAGCSSMA